MRRALAPDKLRAVPEVIIPSKLCLGIFEPLERTYDKFAARMDALSNQYPNARIDLVAHSGSGLLGRLAVHERPELYSSLTTIATPHLDILPKVEKHLRGPLEAFARNLPEHDGASVATLQIGCDDDELVGLDSALAPLPGATRLRVADGNRWPVNHNYLLMRGDVIDAVRDFVDGQTVHIQHHPQQAGAYPLTA
jgi:pimeloyl-ACP methyl ester carboxylesterase